MEEGSEFLVGVSYHAETPAWPHLTRHSDTASKHVAPNDRENLAEEASHVAPGTQRRTEPHLGWKALPLGEGR